MEATIDTTEVRRWKRYDEMRDFEVNWLGQVPAHWETRRLTTVCEFQSGKAHEPFIEEGAPFVCVNSRFVSTQGATRKYCTQNISPAKVNDILMVMSDLPNGRALAKAFFVEQNDVYAVNQRVCIIRPQHEEHAKYLYYLLDRNPIFLRYDDGYNQTHLSNSVFTKYPLLIPPVSEQRAIAAFLDRETARIDALIGHKERLIALLEEKRQAIISHTVTRGLDPNVRIKDSSVEWLGNVPAHWLLMRVKSVATCIQAGTTPPTANQEYFADEDIPWYGPGSFEHDLILGSPPRYLSQIALTDRAARLFRSGSTLIVTIGATLGKVGFIDSDASTNQQITVVTFDEKLIIPKFAAYQMKRLEHIMRGIAPSTTIPIMTQDEVGILPFLLPPWEEQEQIVEFIASSSQKIARSLAKIQISIDRLQEYHSALISAAVTGQIDVRDEVNLND